MSILQLPLSFCANIITNQLSTLEVYNNCSCIALNTNNNKHQQPTLEESPLVYIAWTDMASSSLNTHFCSSYGFYYKIKSKRWARLSYDY